MQKMALTIDTCVFIAYKMNIDKMLRDLRPIIGHQNLKFIISEIVMRELNRGSTYNSDISAIESTMVGLSKKAHRITKDTDIDAKFKEVLDIIERDKPKNTEIIDFVQETNARVLKPNNVDLPYVLNAYWNTDAPFGYGKKKMEFPDAIALYSLNKWAIDHNRHIIAVSKDADWMRFAGQYRDRWSCVSDLGLAVAAIKR